MCFHPNSTSYAALLVMAEPVLIVKDFKGPYVCFLQQTRDIGGSINEFQLSIGLNASPACIATSVCVSFSMPSGKLL